MNTILKTLCGCAFVALAGTAISQIARARHVPITYKITDLGTLDPLGIYSVE